MADGKLVFPIRFDLQKAVADASGDIDKVLRRMQTQINSTPLKIKTDVSELKDMESRLKNLKIPAIFDDQGNELFKEGSLKNIRREMNDLVREWENLAEKERIVDRVSGKYTDTAQGIIKRFADLTGASRTYAKSLSELQAAADKAVATEEKNAQKRADMAAKLTALKNPNMDSLTEVQASLKYYDKLAGSATQFSAGWQICIDKIKQLRERSEELKNTFKTMTSKDVFNMPEGNLTQIKDKVKALKVQMDAAVPDPAAWDAYAKELSRLKGIQKDLEDQQKQATKTEAELRAEREASAAALKKSL